MDILWEEEGFQFGFKRWQGWAVSKVLWEWIPNVVSKAREGAKAYILLDLYISPAFLQDSAQSRVQKFPERLSGIALLWPRHVGFGAQQGSHAVCDLRLLQSRQQDGQQKGVRGYR